MVSPPETKLANIFRIWTCTARALEYRSTAPLGTLWDLRPTVWLDWITQWWLNNTPTNATPSSSTHRGILYISCRLAGTQFHGNDLLCVKACNMMFSCPTGWITSARIVCPPPLPRKEIISDRIRNNVCFHCYRSSTSTILQWRTWSGHSVIEMYVKWNEFILTNTEDITYFDNQSKDRDKNTTYK